MAEIHEDESCLSVPEPVYTALVFRHLPAAMDTSTLAAKLGTTTHVSPLLHKARRLGLDAEQLERLAIQRGCDYYHNGDPLPPPHVSIEQFSNAELAIALLNPALRYDPQTLRLGAAMLSAEGNTPEHIARLAKLERCEAVVRYVAEAGRKFEPQNPFWARLLELLPETPPPKSGVVPHPTRFVAMTGITRRGVETVIEWIRHDRITPEQIEGALVDAVIPDLVELRDAFERAKPAVRELARKAIPAA